jgi:hypothetical protein
MNVKAAPAGLFEASNRDALVLGGALLHGLLLAAVLGAAAQAQSVGPCVVAVIVLCVAMNWGSNTVSHIHLHTPLFRDARANRAFSLYLSVLLGVPQAWWKLRHLAHHDLPAAHDPTTRAALRRQGAWELVALLVLLAALAMAAPGVFATVYVPAMLLGLGLCWVQGHQEHARSTAGVDLHAAIYNRLWFNDGFHAAHHRCPDAHWSSLPGRATADDTVSRWPPTLRWLESLPALRNSAAATLIDVLERATLRLPAVRRHLLRTHGRAWTRLLSRAGIDPASIHTVTIIGGGLFPRTALILSQLLPRARLTIVEAVPAHVARARHFLAGTAAAAATFVEGRLGEDVEGWRAAVTTDLLVLPLAFRGDRARFYRQPPSPLVVIHDWLWRTRGTAGVAVSRTLLKRLNLVRAHGSQVGVVQVHATGGDGSAPQPPVVAGTMSMS